MVRSHADIGNVLINPDDDTEHEPDDVNDVIETNDNCKNSNGCENNKINNSGKILLRGHSQPHLLAQKQEKVRKHFLFKLNSRNLFIQFMYSSSLFRNYQEKDLKIY